MISASLQDKFGRTIKDLRISVTDRCNFHCFYWIADEDIVWKRKPELLTHDEIVRLSEIALAWELRDFAGREANSSCPRIWSY